MQRSSEFPLFLQTAIVLFSFLILTACFSTAAATKSNLTSSLGTTVEVVKNLKFSY